MTAAHAPLSQAASRPRDKSGWLMLAMVGGIVFLLCFMIWGPKPPPLLDNNAMCARHGMTFRPARGPGFCMKADGSLYDFRQLTRSDAPIYRN